MDVSTDGGWAPSVFTLQALQQVAVMGKMTAVLYKALP